MIAGDGTEWSISVVNDEDRSVVRSWSGVGSVARIAWDGTDASGTLVEDEDNTYTFVFEYQGDEGGTITQVQQAGPKKKFKKVTPSKSFPQALALISNISHTAPGAGYRIVEASDRMLCRSVANSFKAIKMRESRFTHKVLFAADVAINPITKQKGLRDLLYKYLTHAQFFYIWGHINDRTRIGPPDGQQGNALANAIPRVTVWEDQMNNGRLMMIADRSQEWLHVTNQHRIDMNDVMFSRWYRKFNFVFIDSCASAGENRYSPTNVEPLEPYWSSPGGPVLYAWPQAVHMDDGSGDTETLNVFMGWNGYSYNNCYDNGAYPSPWLAWRKKFFGMLEDGGSSIKQAQTAANNMMPPYNGQGPLPIDTFYDPRTMNTYHRLVTYPEIMAMQYHFPYGY
ncbi:MAG: hypothetical protein H8F28_05220 [Fibrella sp.]|nr:hypothetical protein [Armatimonadota bacterium]